MSKPPQLSPRQSLLKRTVTAGCFLIEAEYLDLPVVNAKVPFEPKHESWILMHKGLAA